MIRNAAQTILSKPDIFDISAAVPVGSFSRSCLAILVQHITNAFKKSAVPAITRGRPEKLDWL